jgi:hypothetical protein
MFPITEDEYSIKHKHSLTLNLNEPDTKSFLIFLLNLVLLDFFLACNFFLFILSRDFLIAFSFLLLSDSQLFSPLFGQIPAHFVHFDNIFIGGISGSVCDPNQGSWKFCCNEHLVIEILLSDFFQYFHALSWGGLFPVF